MNFGSLTHSRCQHHFFACSDETVQLGHWWGQCSFSCGVSTVDGGAAYRTVAVEVRANKKHLTDGFFSMNQVVSIFTRDRLVADVIKDKASPLFRHFKLPHCDGAVIARECKRVESHDCHVIDMAAPFWLYGVQADWNVLLREDFKVLWRIASCSSFPILTNPRVALAQKPNPVSAAKDNLLDVHVF